MATKQTMTREEKTASNDDRKSYAVPVAGVGLGAGLMAGGGRLKDKSYDLWSKSHKGRRLAVNSLLDGRASRVNRLSGISNKALNQSRRLGALGSGMRLAAAPITAGSLLGAGQIARRGKTPEKTASWNLERLGFEKEAGRHFVVPVSDADVHQRLRNSYARGGESLPQDR